MENLFLVAVMAVLGAMFGSFAGAQVWRLRARQLRDEDSRLGQLKGQNQLSDDDKEEKEYLAKESKSRKQERAKLNRLLVNVRDDHSRCLSCGHELAWYDLLPLMSWLSMKGRCRYCQTRIGYFEPLMEIGVAILFVVSYIFWPLPLTTMADNLLLVLWLTSSVLLAVLFAYDVKWFLLPDVANFSLIGLAAIMAALRIVTSDDMLMQSVSIVGAIMVLSGLYLLLWYASKGRWVGFGDVKLGLGLALLLADWRLALLALFLANFIGTLIVIPGMAMGRIGRKAQVPFGPLLIAGTVITFLVGNWIIDVYLSIFY